MLDHQAAVRRALGGRRQHMHRLGRGVGCLALAFGSASLSFAQDGERITLEEVTVTGSRIQHSGFNTPTPVTIVSRDMIDDLGIVNVGDVIAQMPVNNAQVSPTNASQGSLNNYVSDANIGAQLANLRGLNPFFGTRTLTLVDGHRFVPSTNGGSVDLGLIPSNLVERTEIVTGGASAAYGADAVAGVVNVVLDHDLEGLRTQLDYGETFRGDGESFHAGIAAGTSLFGGRGHIVAGGEYDDSKAVGSCTETRSWCRPWAIFDTADNFEVGYPDYFLVDNARATATFNGSVIAATRNVPGVGPGTGPFAVPTGTAFTELPAFLLNKQFNGAGTSLVDWETGNFIDPATRLMAGGDAPNSDYGTLMRVPVERYSLYTRLQYDFTDRMEGFIEASYGRRKASNSQTGLQGSLLGTGAGGALIKQDNFYLPADVASALQASTFTGFYLNKHNAALPTPVSEADNQTYRTVLGLKGEFGESWRWDGYYTFGRNEQSQRYINARRDTRLANNATGMAGGPVSAQTAETVSNFDWAIDVIDDGNGNPICRVTQNAAVLANPAIAPIARACVPINLFGTGNISQAAIDYAFGVQTEDYTYDQQVLGLNLQGRPIQAWAGPLAVATGIEYRVEEGETTHGEIATGEYWSPDYGADFAGELELVEAYLESELPLLRDAPAARSLDLNAAVRRTRSTASNETTEKTFNLTTWKGNLTWAPVDWLRFRATRSRDVRAPGFRELFFPGRTTPNFPITNIWTGQRDPADLISNGGGNPDLIPEEADTWTFGFVFQPPWAWSEGVRLSLDFYDIELRNGIANVYSNGVMAACLESGGTDVLCDRIEGVGNPASGFTDITSVTTGSLNANAFRTRGMDMEIAYRLPLSRLVSSWQGNLAFRVLGSYMDEMRVEKENRGTLFGASLLQTGAGTNYAGQVGAGGVDDVASFSESPRLQLNATLSYSNGPFRSTLQARYVGSAKLYTDLIGPGDPFYDIDLDNTINVNEVGSYTLFNFSSSYEFTLADDNSVEVFGVINNLFDKEPLIAPPLTGPGAISGGGSTVTNPVYYDTIGRTFRVGVRLRY